MQCQNCKEQVATIHLTEIENGQRHETHLCQECAQQQGLAIQSQLSLNELLGTLLSAQNESKTIAEGSESTKVEMMTCPACGMTLDKFRKLTLLGCPNDYQVFDKPLELLIKRAHNGNVTHHGKIPSKAPADSKKQIELINLQKELATAVKNEDYETAAKLRDQIEHLK